MARLTFAEAQNHVVDIANREVYNIDFVYELLAAYGRARSAITKLREGSLNLAVDKNNEVLQRGVIYFKYVPDPNKLHSTVEELAINPLVVRYNPRYLIVSDYERLVAVDTKKNSRLDIKLRDIDRDVDFFFGWTGDEITDEKTEAVADRRAADKMKDLYDEIERINRDKLVDPTSNFRHDLNVFFSRLLFCFFAEDTRVFSRSESHMFTDAIKDFTQTDGSDLDQFLETLFDALDTEDKSKFTSPFSKFPYVNGTIFDTKKHGIGIPRFNAQARKLILDCGNQNWAEINPDIFGSMFQSIVDEELRSAHGQHYTSVPNIMKTIEPLFLDELRGEFDKHYDNEQRLLKLWDRISKIKIFDPACGSGNFLIIAYKELRRIEHAIIERVYGDEHKRKQLVGKLESRIKLDNFFGIEIDDFPHEIAILSLYLAKHQMNIDFEQQFGREIKLIPLKDNANIIRGNSARLDWNEVCPNVANKITPDQLAQQSTLIEFDDEQPELELQSEEWEEIYLIGNPPYLGGKGQSKEQKEDLKIAFQKYGNYKELDYIAIWFIKAAEYAKPKTKISFVTTSSINQGAQVEQLWPKISSLGVEITFAYLPFSWSNSARGKAGVTCSIIGLGFEPKKKILISGQFVSEANNINAYLLDAPDLIIKKSNSPISSLPKIITGNTPYDGTYLMLNREERDEILNSDHRADRFIRPAMGANELTNNIDRWCIWIKPEDAHEAMTIDLIAERVESVRKYREKGGDVAKGLLAVPYRFRYTHTAEKSSIIIPIVSSSRRIYLPANILGSETIIIGSAAAIYDPEPWVFGIISSLMHMTWVKATAGRLREDLRYLSALSYNTFPIRPLLDHEKQELTQKARQVIFARENHSEKTLAQLYDPSKMPADLLEAHQDLDTVVDKLYRSKPYNIDEERLTDLFALYEQMTLREKTG